MFDNQSSAIQRITPIGGKSCKEFIRINADEKWKICAVPFTGKTFWYLEIDKIIFVGLNCLPDKVSTLYVPGLDLNIDYDINIPMTKEADIIDWVLQRMMGARQGTVVDMTNDGNPNKTIASEINNIFSQIKTKA